MKHHYSLINPQLTPKHYWHFPTSLVRFKAADPWDNVGREVGQCWISMFWKHSKAKYKLDRHQSVVPPLCHVSTMSTLCVNGRGSVCTPSGRVNSHLSAASPALPGFSLWPMKRLHHDRTVELSSLSCHLQTQRGWVTSPRSHSCLEENHTPLPHAAANLFPGLLPLSFPRMPLCYHTVSIVQT